MRRVFLSIMVAVILATGGIANGGEVAHKKAIDEYLYTNAAYKWSSLRLLLFEVYNFQLPHWDKVVFDPPKIFDKGKVFISSTSPAAKDRLILQQFMQNLGGDKGISKTLLVTGSVWLIPPGRKLKMVKVAAFPEIEVQDMETDQVLYVPRWAVYCPPTN